jgi:hypothetical protein
MCAPHWIQFTTGVLVILSLPWHDHRRSRLVGSPLDRLLMTSEAMQIGENAFSFTEFRAAATSYAGQNYAGFSGAIQPDGARACASPRGDHAVKEVKTLSGSHKALNTTVGKVLPLRYLLV